MSTTQSPALQAALAAIAREFNRTHVNGMARGWIRKSFGNAATQARVAHYIERFTNEGCNLDEACGFLRADCALPRRALISRELHLILRWMRARKMHAAFAETVAALRSPVRVLEAAE